MWYNMFIVNKEKKIKVMSDTNQLKKMLRKLGYDASEIYFVNEPDYSIKKMKEFEKEYKISSKAVIDKNFQLQDKMPYKVIKEWLSYIDTAHYFDG